ncbi:MAG: hypothetical protein DID91_2727704087 [Candidatus Nitrotoga sp. MKT]|nr:MAG: hypothetical protein DID91_2727704087 [Candidatus Nitrotoga sp. MKT]
MATVVTAMLLFLIEPGPKKTACFNLDMEIIDNINNLLGDSLKQTLKPGSKLKIAASCFSIYAYEALELELERIESLEFIFTSPTFVPGEATDKLNKEHRQYHIPKLEREPSFYGSEFEIQLNNKLTQRAIAKECDDWIRRKASFRSNRGTAPMQQFAGVQTADATAIRSRIDRWDLCQPGRISFSHGCFALWPL